jgi:CPA2 family monovalent cation:H+ antiporter-2
MPMPRSGRPTTCPHDSKIIIAGAGRVGGLVERILTAAGHNATMIDFSSRRLQVMERFGFKHYFGDATRPDLLAAAGIGEAKLLVVAIDDRDQISELVKYVCATYPDLPVVARASGPRSCLRPLGLWLPQHHPRDL